MLEEIVKLIVTGIVAPILLELWKEFRVRRTKRLEEIQVDLPKIETTIPPASDEDISSSIFNMTRPGKGKVVPRKLCRIAVLLISLVITSIITIGVWGIAELTDNVHEVFVVTLGIAIWIVLSRRNSTDALYVGYPTSWVRVVATIAVLTALLWVAYLAIEDIVTRGLQF